MSEALRDDFPVCPVDGSALEPVPDGSRYTCGSCKGIQIGEAAVVAVIAEVVEDAPKTLPLEPPNREEPVRTCPHCATQMTKHLLYSIQIDRCAAHGIWFDGEELQRVLEKIGVDPIDRRNRRGAIVAGAATIVYIAANLAALLLR